MKREQKFVCRHDGHTVIGRRSFIEQEMSRHLIKAHGITDSLRMALSIERIW